ncbi:MAG: DUF5706 domain-containing protein [Firmicutes bacterium]|nr:DUF5706 domain-containing protein [Bacillota bacterium]
MNKKIEELKFILNRLDVYLESSQNKSNLYLALNTIVLGGVITIIATLQELDCSFLLNFLLLFIALASIASILLTLSAINPYIKSSKKTKSVFFFKDIATHNSPEEYRILLDTHIASEKKMVKDMSSQVYSMAKGLSMKYKKLTIVGFIIAGEFVLMAIWAIIFLVTKSNIIWKYLILTKM